MRSVGEVLIRMCRRAAEPLRMPYFVMLCALAPQLVLGQSALIRGRVVGGKGAAPVAGAVVRLTRVSDLPTPSLGVVNAIADPGARPLLRSMPMGSAGLLPLELVAESDRSGAFSFAGLAPGQYTICATSSELGALDSCLWEAGPPVPIALGDAQRMNDLTVKLPDGREYEVLITDNARILDSNESRSAGADLVVGIWSANGKFQPARLKQTSSTGRTYSVVVPFERPVRLDVHARRLVVEDEDGKTIFPGDEARVVTEPASAIESPRQFRFVVKALEP